MDLKLVIFSANFFSFNFRQALQPELGPHFRSTSAIETGERILGFHTSRETTIVEICRKQLWYQGPVYLPGKQQDLCCLPCPATHPGTPQAAPRAVGMWLLWLCRLWEQLRRCATTILTSSRTRRVVAVREIAVDERDPHSQREEKMTPEDSSPSVKRMCRVSLAASTMLLLHGLRCSGATSPM